MALRPARGVIHGSSRGGARTIGWSGSCQNWLSPGTTVEIRGRVRRPELRLRPPGSTTTPKRRARFIQGTRIVCITISKTPRPWGKRSASLHFAEFEIRLDSADQSFQRSRAHAAESRNNQALAAIYEIIVRIQKPACCIAPVKPARLQVVRQGGEDLQAATAHPLPHGVNPGFHGGSSRL